MSVFELTRRQTRVFGDASSGTDVAENWTLPFAGSFVKLRSRNSPNGTWPLTGHAVNSTANIMRFRNRFALQFDLPTEAQWEYACRAGSARAFDGSQTTASNGNHQDNLKDYGWFTENSGGVAHPVGTKLPNAWGLYDMHGNLAEYCLDAVSDKMGLTDGQLGSETPVTDPFGAYSGVVSDTQRMFRGGAYSSDFFRCRSGNRNNESANHPDSAWPSLGYRLVCPLPGATFAEPVIPVE